MKKKTNVEILASLRKMNLIAREKNAIKNGFPTAVAYMVYLLGGKPEATIIKETLISKRIIKKVKSTMQIHIVDILDRSGSMGWGMTPTKISLALQAIHAGIAALKTDKEFNYTYSLCTFSGFTEIRMPYLLMPLPFIGKIGVVASGGTALYDAIGGTLESIATKLKSGDKVLVNIYTDGEENNSRKYKSKDISNMIEEYQQKGFTITFIGTERDTKRAIAELKIDSSNTLAYDGTAEGLSKSMLSTNSLRSFFSASATRGEDVSKGFYKNIKQ